MKCLNCGSFLHVKSSNLRSSGFTSRTRVCKNCGTVIRTVEVRTQEYDALKLLVSDLKLVIDKFVKRRKGVKP